MFNEYYASTGILDDNNIPSCPTVVSSTLETVSFTETSAVSAINKLKSSGPDGLPPVLFKTFEELCCSGLEISSRIAHTKLELGRCHTFVKWSRSRQRGWPDDVLEIY